MAGVITLQKSSFESGKIAVKKGDLFSKKQLETLKSLEFEEILKYLEENGFKDEIDTSYLSYEGFYLVEVILNKHLSSIYGDVLGSSSKKNKDFFDVYYLKYQIHNIMAVIRCKKSSEETISPYLIGDSRRKEKYLKAFSMPTEDALVYMSKKLKFEDKQVLHYYKLGIFELENYLYKTYYEKLLSKKYSFNSKDEIKFYTFIKSYIDILNMRVFSKLIIEEIKAVSFEEFYIKGGNISLSFFDSLKGMKLDEVFTSFSKKSKSTIEKPHDIDRLLTSLKKETAIAFSTIGFGSPFYVLKFFFDLEKEISTLRTLLKAKFLKLPADEIDNLI